MRVRHVQFQFPTTIERYWLANNPFKTHLLNSLTLLLPDFEQYAIWAIKPELKRIENLQLKREALNFVGQESQHSSAHKKFWNNLTNQGYELEKPLQFLRWVLNDLFKKQFSQKLNLAIVAGFEHLTELFAELALKENFLAEATPELKLLFEWHAAEELEHKTVAYDVLRNSTQSYGIRVLGLTIACVFLLGFTFWGLFVLLFQDQKVLKVETWKDLIRFLVIKERFAPKMAAAFVDYLRRNFHPSQRDNLYLCRSVMTQMAGTVSSFEF